VDGAVAQLPLEGASRAPRRLSGVPYGNTPEGFRETLANRRAIAAPRPYAPSCDATGGSKPPAPPGDPVFQPSVSARALIRIDLGQMA